MLLAIDDTDSPRGMCTTYLMVRLIHEIGLDLIGLPRLVRLNPNIRYKTRGNAALCAEFGEGNGSKTQVGTWMGNPIYSWPGGHLDGDPEEVADIAASIVGGMYERDENTNPGIVVSEKAFPEKLYHDTLQREMQKEEALAAIRDHGAAYREFGNGRGIIGASAALAWRKRRRTFELIVYDRTGPALSRTQRMKIANWTETFQGVFNSTDGDRNTPLIFPSPRTPVFAGIRSVNFQSLLEMNSSAAFNETMACSSSLIFETNQGTDDHIVENPDRLTDMISCSITCVVSSTPVSRTGGHWFCTVDWKGNNVEVAAFEPSKRLRHAFSSLEPGDLIRIFGSYNSGVLNLEKMEVVSASRSFSRSSGRCRRCDSQMRNVGKGTRKCVSCGNTCDFNSFIEDQRELARGWFQAPPSSQRHLYRPVGLDLAESA